MIKNKDLWKGIVEDKWYLLACDAFYFTISTHTSLGYGDIIPKSRIIRIITSLHMITTVFTFFFFIYYHRLKKEPASISRGMFISFCKVAWMSPKVVGRAAVFFYCVSHEAEKS